MGVEIAIALGAVISSVVVGLSVKAGMEANASASANATIKASENAMTATIESARLQADAQKHISDNEKFNAGEDRKMRKVADARDADITDKWMRQLDHLFDSREDFAHGELVRADGSTSRVRLEERAMPSVAVQI